MTHRYFSKGKAGIGLGNDPLQSELAADKQSPEPLRSGEPKLGLRETHSYQPLDRAALTKMLNPWTCCILGLTPVSDESPVFDEQLRNWLRYKYDQAAGRQCKNATTKRS